MPRETLADVKEQLARERDGVAEKRRETGAAVAKKIADAVKASQKARPEQPNGKPRKGRTAAEDPDPTREDRFITCLQAALEAELGETHELDFKERNSLYVNCIKFLAVLTKYTDRGDDDGKFWGED